MRPSATKWLSFILQILLGIGILLEGWFPVPSYGQENASPLQKKEDSSPESDRDFTVRIAVEEVRLDAVVLDKKGRPISDLKAEDFEVFQDGRPQTVLSSTYISNQLEPSASPALPGKRATPAISIPTPVLERNEVRRVLVFVVDDVSMNFVNLHHARLALRRFVERQMQPGDLMAILRTGAGNSALEMFLSDKQKLLARIDAIRWGSNAGFTFVQPEFNIDFRDAIFGAQLAALRYSLGALRNLPGRKMILLLSAQPTLPNELAKNAEELFDHFTIDYYDRYIEAYNRLADQALRVGVVVHLLDIRGLEAPFPDSFPGGGATYEEISDRLADGLNPLPAKTGGVFLENSNFFVDGIGRVNNMLKGYYLLSYSPPPDTFKSDGKNTYHRTTIKVKRKGASVHTRDGFYGVTGSEEGSAAAQNPLQAAVFSPFQYNDLAVNLASGYTDDAQEGYMLRSWLHLDARNVSFLEKKGEGYLVFLETVCLTSDVNGYIRDSSLMHYVFRVNEENLSWVKKHGIRFSLFLPVKEPGAYTVRAAVKDEESGKVGSAYQFVEIPDLKKNRLALSDIFVVNSREDAAWILSGETEEIPPNGISPILRRDESRSPAMLSYLPGDYFRYMSVIYNAKFKKDDVPDLESGFVLYKDGSELFKGDFQPLNLGDLGKFDRIPIRGKLLLGKELVEGDYVLQLLVRDRNRKKKEGIAAKTMNFRIVTQQQVR